MEDQRFTNQVAIITGAGQGIGFEIARQLAMAGASVLLNDIDVQLANRAAGVINMQWGANAIRWQAMLPILILSSRWWMRRSTNLDF